MKISITDEAKNDLKVGYQFYEAQMDGLGTYFFESIFSDIDSLAYFAGIHSKIFGFYRLLVKKFPFAIYYQIKDKTILIVAIVDCRQKPKNIRKRIK